jgi:hypothetical protein
MTHRTLYISLLLIAGLSNVLAQYPDHARAQQLGPTVIDGRVVYTFKPSDPRVSSAFVVRQPATVEYVTSSREDERVADLVEKRVVLSFGPHTIVRASVGTSLWPGDLIWIDWVGVKKDGGRIDLALVPSVVYVHCRIANFGR